MAVRDDFVQAAVGAAPELSRVLTQLTLEEALTALDLEAATNRRSWTLRRLIGRVVAIESMQRRESLSRRYLGK